MYLRSKLCTFQISVDFNYEPAGGRGGAGEGGGLERVGNERKGGNREEVFMEGTLEPNMGPSLADVLLCTFHSTNQGCE